MLTRTEIIVIDIDNTITAGYPAFGDYELCTLAKGAKKAIDEIRKEYLVFLHTGRHIQWAYETMEWLKKHKIKYDHIQFGKPPAILYIDDKGMEHKSWKTTLTKMRKKKILGDTQNSKMT